MSAVDAGATVRVGSLRLEAPAGRLFIGGSWVRSASGHEQAVEDPSDESTLRHVGWGDGEDVDRAVTHALDAAEGWGQTDWTHRARVLRQLADRLRADGERLAAVDTAESGNPIAGSRQDVGTAATALEFFAGLAGQTKGETFLSGPSTHAFTERSPYGVVGRLLAYNHPLLFAVQAAAAPLAAGNAVILKPADPTPLSALEVARLAEDLLPAGALSVVPGSGAAAGHALAAHPDVPRIAFTGSVATGRRVMATAAEHVKHVTLELGGKNPLVVFPDVDPADAARAAVDGMNFTKTNGQSCQATSRVLVHEDVHDELVRELADRMRALRVGPPADPRSDVGPLTFRSHYERVLAHIDGANRAGARLVTGGARPAGLTRGYYVRPTLFTDVPAGSAILQEEVFGPVLVVSRWRDEEEMVAAANGTPYGLTANVLTHDLGRALRTARRLRAGLVWVNGPSPRPLGVPFGGHKLSGRGKEHGLEELLSYTQDKSVVVRYG